SLRGRRSDDEAVPPDGKGAGRPDQQADQPHHRGRVRCIRRDEPVGQKVSPVGLRVGIIRDWESKWYAGKDYADLLHEDIRIREYIGRRLKDAAVSTIEIERAANRVNITIHTAKPGMVIG